jgi:hypothetical protein
MPHAPHMPHVVLPQHAGLDEDTWTPTSQSHWLGKCPQCKTAKRVTVQQEARRRYVWDTGTQAYISTPEYRQVPLAAGAQYHASRTGPSAVTVPCPTGCQYYSDPRMITCKRVQGSLNEGIKCGAKCVNATGPSCECSCAGANHGAMH